MSGKANTGTVTGKDTTIMSKHTIEFTDRELQLLREALWKAQCADVRESCSRDFSLEEQYENLKEKLNPQ